MSAPVVARIARYRVEWDSEHLRVTMPGSRWRDGLLTGVLGGGMLSMIWIYALTHTNENQRGALAAIAVTVGLSFGFGFWLGRALEGFAIEAFLTGSRAVWIRQPDAGPRMVPLEKIAGFVTVEHEISGWYTQGQKSRVYGVELRTKAESLALLPKEVPLGKLPCEILSALLNAVILKQGSSNEALARAGNLRRTERRILIVTLVALAGLIGWLAWFFTKR